SGCTAERLASALGPNGLHSLGVSIRATWSDVISLSQDLAFAKDRGASDADIQEIQMILAEFTDAFQKNRGMTVPLPLCSSSQDLARMKDKAGQNFAYDNPVMVLVDGFTASAAELFSAILQDNNRALLYGTTTDGAGGTVDLFGTGVYGETAVSLAFGIAIRS